jgi:hypothetical protein
MVRKNAKIITKIKPTIAVIAKEDANAAAVASLMLATTGAVELAIAVTFAEFAATS